VICERCATVNEAAPPLAAPCREADAFRARMLALYLRYVSAGANANLYLPRLTENDWPLYCLDSIKACGLVSRLRKLWVLYGI